MLGVTPDTPLMSLSSLHSSSCLSTYVLPLLIVTMMYSVSLLDRVYL